MSLQLEEVRYTNGANVCLFNHSVYTIMNYDYLIHWLWYLYDCQYYNDPVFDTLWNYKVCI